MSIWITHLLFKSTERILQMHHMQFICDSMIEESETVVGGPQTL